MNEEKNIMGENVVNNDNQPINQEVNQNVDVAPEELEPQSFDVEVLGDLKKDKIGKPTLVLEILAILIVVLIAIPQVNKMLNDENSELYKLIYGSPTPIVGPNQGTTTVTGEEYLDGKELQLISPDINIKYENLIITGMYLKRNAVFADIKSYNGVLDLDARQLYVEIYSKSEKLLATIKLTGKVAAEEAKYELTNKGLLFNDSDSYYIKIKEMQDGDFPSVSLPSDESGLGTLICSKNERTIEYTFKNNYLIGITDTENVLLSDYTESEYLDLIGKYRTKSENLNTESHVVENDLGFTFFAMINLEQEGYTIPTSVYDNNYYALDKEAKFIKYEQTGKGFDCK